MWKFADEVITVQPEPEWRRFDALVGLGCIGTSVPTYWFVSTLLEARTDPIPQVMGVMAAIVVPLIVAVCYILVRIPETRWWRMSIK